jgi:hypothetical protein
MDESKRDFAKCGEIDYQNNPIWVLEGEGGMGYPDYDPANKKVVFSAGISVATGKNRSHFEIFLQESGKKKKRVTWDATNNSGNLNPFWAKDRRIGYFQSNTSSNPAKIKYFVINEDGTGKTEIGKDIKDNKEFTRLYKETHDTNECRPITLTK